MARDPDRAVVTIEATQFQNAASAVVNVQDELDGAIKALE
jgi:hypothetical protein